MPLSRPGGQAGGMRRTVAPLLVMALVALGACGQDDVEDALTPSSTSTTATTGPDAEPQGPSETTPFDPFAGNGGACTDRPVWVSTHQPAPEVSPEEAPDLSCVEPEDAPSQGGGGPMQITLTWDSSADLDLHVTEPDGTEIYYGNRGPTASGGTLDGDDNVGCSSDGSIEHVSWPAETMPSGAFTVEVDGYSVEGCGGGAYDLVAEVDGEVLLDESGEVAEDETESYNFEN